MSEGDNDVDPLIGRVFASRYKIEGRLGAGAMGVVYRARHVKVGRPFAVKMLHERLLADEKLRKRFDREAELAGKLHHVNVVGVVDVGETEDGIHFMVMEFADGVPLGRLVDGPMPAARVIDLAKQLCEGLQHAHEHGLIHRDFKPDNVIVERDRSGAERPRIVDFGISILRDDAVVPGRAERLTTAGLVLGTPHYMAPEHAMGGGIDHRIDLFAFGVILYELLTGQLPFDGDGVDVARANLLTATPPMGVRVPGVVVDPLLEAFTRMLMQKDPDNRPQTAKEARRLLELIATDRNAAATALDVELSADDPKDRIAVTPPTTPSPSPAQASRTPHTRTDAVVHANGHRVATAPGEARPAAISSGQARPGSPTALAGDRRADTGSDGDHRAATQPGRRAATVLPAPRRVFAIGIGVGLVVAIALIVMVATRGGGLPAEPIDAASAIAVTPVDADPGIAPALDAAIAVAMDAPPPDAAVATVTRNSGTNPQTPPKPPKPPKPPGDPVEPTVLDTSSAAVAELYGAVGRELKALDLRRGTAATSTLWPRYLRIRINDVLLTPEKRIEAHRELGALRKAIAAQR